MLMKAMVKNKTTKKLEIIESEYPSKQTFIIDLRANGYAVDPVKVKESKVFDYIINNTNCDVWDWREIKQVPAE